MKNNDIELIEKFLDSWPNTGLSHEENFSIISTSTIGELPKQKEEMS